MACLLRRQAEVRMLNIVPFYVMYGTFRPCQSSHAGTETSLLQDEDTVAV